MDERTRDNANENLWRGSDALPSLVRTLRYAVRALETSIGKDSGLLDRLARLDKRLSESQLQVAVVGQFKRGKSTFINALLGAPLLPVDVVPLTAVPIFITWSESPCARVQFKGGRASEELIAHHPDAIRDFLFRYVSEEANPKNRLGVGRVELLSPAPLLAGGMMLIDTPGVGSTFRHNTEAALNVLPECDAALFVISADPPITEAELTFLREVKTKAVRIFYVLNKIDYFQPGEQESVARFLRRVLAENGLWAPESKIVGVSARRGLDAKLRGDREAIKAAGMTEVEGLLLHQLAFEKAKLLNAALTAKVIDGLAQGMGELSLRRQALKLPLDELAARAKAFGERLEAIEERYRILPDLLAGEQRALRQEIERGIASLRLESERELVRLLEGNQGHETGATLPVAIERIFNAACARMAGDFWNRVAAVIAHHQKRIDEDVTEVKRAAADIFQAQFSDLASTATFTAAQEPYWVTQATGAGLIPDAGAWLDYWLPARWRAARAKARQRREIRELVIRNAENLRWALLRKTDEAFREATANLQSRVGDALYGTRRIIEETLGRRRNESYAIEPELDRLGRARDLLSVLLQQVSDQHAFGGPRS